MIFVPNQVSAGQEEAGSPTAEWACSGAAEDLENQHLTFSVLGRDTKKITVTRWRMGKNKAGRNGSASFVLQDTDLVLTVSCSSPVCTLGAVRIHAFGYLAAEPRELTVSFVRKVFRLC